MNKLKFKLISNNLELINVKIPYFVKNNLLNFKISDDLYHYDTKSHILSKKNQEQAIIIDVEKNIITISLIKENLQVCYPMLNSNITVGDNIVKIEYTLESDETLINVIFIEF